MKKLILAFSTAARIMSDSDCSCRLSTQAFVVNPSGGADD
jgi:hypothetical protein